MGQAAEGRLRRGGQRDPLHAGDLGGDDVHDHRAGVDGQAPGRVQAHAAHRDPALDDPPARDDLGDALDGQLGGVTGAVVGDGQLQALAHGRIEVRQRALDRARGHPQVLGAHVVEALGGVAQGGGPAGAHVLDEGGDRLQGGGHVEVGAGQDRGEVAGVRVGVAQVDAGEHAPTLPSGGGRPDPGPARRRGPQPKSARGTTQMPSGRW